jgi:hypothetical protein
MTDRWKIGEDLEVSIHDLNKALSQHFFGGNEESKKISVTVAGDMVGIRTKYLAATSVEHYVYTILFKLTMVMVTVDG